VLLVVGSIGRTDLFSGESMKPEDETSGDDLAKDLNEDVPLKTREAQPETVADIKDKADEQLSVESEIGETAETAKTAEAKDEVNHTQDTPASEEVLVVKSKPLKRSCERSSEDKGDAKRIAAHYNQIQPIGRADRQSSAISGLRNFNNWVKSVLINEFSLPDVSTVLDLACGKGGDLPKWKRTRVKELVGVDIADLSVEEARRRYADIRPHFRAEYHVLDAFHQEWSAVIPEGKTFDLISCQFALHYCFESEESARHTIKSVAEHLAKGGHFFGTIPSFSTIRRKLLASDDKRTISSPIFSLRLDEGMEAGLAYGRRYSFDLQEAIDACPEYFIPFPMLETLAEEYGLELCLEEGFQHFFTKFADQHGELLRRMHIVDGRGEMALSAAELEVAGLYMAFCFRKI